MLRSALTCSVARVLVQSVEKLDCLKNLNQLENFRNLKKIHPSKAWCVFTLFLQTLAEYVKKYIERRYLMIC